MPIVRANPKMPCRDGQHHPHRYECADPDCCEPDTWELNGVGEYVWLGPNGLWCCIDGEVWPCQVRQAHMVERKATAVLP